MGLLVEFQVRYPGRYSLRQLYALQKRVGVWRRQAVQRLIGEIGVQVPCVAPVPAYAGAGAGNILAEAFGNKIG